MNDNKIALVTGASSGIGRHTAEKFIEADYCVVVTGRRKELLDEVVAGHGDDKTLACAADLTNPDDVDKLFRALEDKFGRLDVVFNNAGNNVPPAPFGDISFEDWKTVIDVNLNGAFLVANRAFRLMRKQTPQGGRIINNGSISAYVPRPGSAPYTSSKHAITGLTRTISLDGRAFNIACGQIDIGNAASEMTQRMQTGVPQADGSTAIEPVMDVGNVSQAVLQMAALPLDVNVQFMTIMATGMPYIGRG